MQTFVATVFALSFVSYASAGTEQTHCADGETIYFSCHVKGSKKIASVCGAEYNVEKKVSGYIQYRFGAIGKREMMYPSTTAKEEMKDRFTFSASRSAEYDHYDLELQFTNLGYAYAIHSNEAHKSGAITYSSSVTVWKLAKPCLNNCQPRAPFESPKKVLVQVFSCSNQDAGRNLYLNSVVRLMTSPGVSSENKF
jgi:hypothetical protein